MSNVIGDALSLSSASPPALRSAISAELLRPLRECGYRIPEMATTDMMAALPCLPDDNLVGVEDTEHIVRRDNEPDLRFRGTLLASVATDRARASTGRWKEFRVYETSGGNWVFSQVGRSVLEGERDKFQAEVFNAPPTPFPSIRDAVRISSGLPSASFADNAVRTPPATFLGPIDQQRERISAMTRFFGFGDMAKELYARLGVRTEERID